MFSELIASNAHGFSFQAKYGFVAFSDPEDFLKAWKEMDGSQLLYFLLLYLTLVDFRQIRGQSAC